MTSTDWWNIEWYTKSDTNYLYLQIKYTHSFFCTKLVTWNHNFHLKVMISSPLSHHFNTKKWMYVLCVQTWVWNTHHSKEKILGFLWLEVLNMFYFVIHKQNNKLIVGTKLTINWK